MIKQVIHNETHQNRCRIIFQHAPRLDDDWSVVLFLAGKQRKGRHVGSGYRLFLLKWPSGFVSREEFEAPSDEMAIEKARELAEAHPYASGYEVWERARLVHRAGKAFEQA